MKNRKNDLWFNIYVFLLLPFCILINIWNIIKYAKDFDYLDNIFITVLQFVLCGISIIYYAITVYYAKDTDKKAYPLIIGSLALSIFVASFNQILATYYNMGLKTYSMFAVYIILFVCLWGMPNYVYFERRKDMFEHSNVVPKEVLKEKIAEAIKKENKETKKDDKKDNK